MTAAVEARLRESAARTEETLALYLGREDKDFCELLCAERYSLFAGGKRIRPYLCLAFCRLFGGDERRALPFACALEMIHTYSLIHDDLPCMDNDDLRRGKPTNHKVYGEATALLAGDSLLTRAFGVAAGAEDVSPEAVREAIVTLSEASGPFGMIGGQIMDLRGESETLTMEELLRLHSLKTGALITAAVRLGCLAAGISLESREMAMAETYAKCIGLAFQVVDDILDTVGDTAILGKPVGSDAEQNKTTFMSFYTVEEAEAYASELTAKAVSALADLPHSEELTDLAVYLLNRKH